MPKGHFVSDEHCDAGIGGYSDGFGAFRDTGAKGYEGNGEIGHSGLGRVSG